MNTKHVILASALATVSLAAAQPAAAQSSLLPAASEKGVGVEVMRPDFKMFEMTAPSTVWFLSGRLPIGDRLRVIADVPIAHAEIKGGGILGNGSSTVIGNPLIGADFLLAPGIRAELSGRAPLTTADDQSLADVIAILSDPLGGEAFLMDALPVAAGLTVERSPVDGLDLRARGGVTTTFYTGSDEEVENNSITSVDYGIFGSYTAGIARFGTGLSGRWDASADEGSFSERSLHQLGLTADAKIGGVRPGIAVRMPLDKDLREIVGMSIGMYLQVPLR